MALDNKAIQKYLRQAKRIYYGDKELKKQFMQNLQDALFCYAETNPKCSYSDLTSKFGTPDEIKESFSSLSSGILEKRNVWFWRFVIFCSVLITIIVITLTFFYVKRAHDFSNGYYIEYMEEQDKPMISPTPEMPGDTPYKEYTFD